MCCPAEQGEHQSTKLHNARPIDTQLVVLVATPLLDYHQDQQMPGPTGNGAQEKAVAWRARQWLWHIRHACSVRAAWEPGGSVLLTWLVVVLLQLARLGACEQHHAEREVDRGPHVHHRAVVSGSLGV